MTTRLALVAATLLSTGCLSRTLLDVQDAIDGETTILTTLDVKDYVLFTQAKTVFWECGGQGDALTCVKRCDVRDDQGDKLKCQQFVTF